MKKTLLISFGVLLLVSCSKTWQGVTDTVSDDFNSGVKVPVVVSIGKSGETDSKSSVPTKGIGAIDEDEGRNWKDVNVYVYAFNRNSNNYASLASSVSNNCLLDASVDSPGWRAGRRAFYDGSDSYLSWVDSDKEVFYPTGPEIYDFYAYYIDNLNVPQSSITRSRNYISFPVTIDGSSDLMTGHAVFRESAFKGTMFSEPEKEKIRKYAFSSYTARRDINPKLEFKHHLTRIRFEMYPASDGANTVVANAIELKSKDWAIFMVVNRESEKVGLDFSADKSYATLSLCEADGTPLKQDVYHTDYQGNFTDALYERPHVKVGGSLLVAPDYRYEVTMKMVENKGTSHSTQSTFTINTADGFKAGCQYVVRLAIYGLMDVRAKVDLEPWGSGGSLILDDEDKYVPKQ